ncbi:hypothetical protein RUND412_003319 [Rhizina undulata]
MPTSQKPTLAFIGAATARCGLELIGPNGGCALAALSRALEAGYDCSALGRPPKLLKPLQLRGITQETIDAHLTIIPGDAKSADSIKQLLAVSSDSSIARDIIICCVGEVPNFLPNPFRPTLHDPTICQTTTATILSVLKSSYPNSPPPVLLAISTTGIDTPRDIPLLMVPLYHWILPVPHADKKVMEELIIAGKEEGVISEYVIVKPGLLTDGPAKGVDGVRAGYEGRVKNGDGRWGDVEGVAVGYTVSRQDVGAWVFEEVVVRGGGEWGGGWGVER